MIGIYKITNPKESIYIGKSLDIKRRFVSYKHLSCKGQIKIYRSLIKYGYENHIFEILEICDENELNSKERYWQDFYDAINRKNMNLKLTESDDKSGRLSEETKLKISLNHGRGMLGKNHSQEVKDKIRDAHKGRIFTEDHIENLKLNSARTKSRKVINTETGEIFNTIKEGAESIGMKAYSLVWRLRGRIKNKTPFEYYIEEENEVLILAEVGGKVWK
jgi:group I intron endonuclease